MPRPLIASIAAAAFLSSCSQAPSLPPDLRARDVRTIRDFETAWNRDLTRNDVERLVSRYSDDAVLQIPNRPPANGLEAIRNAVKQEVQDGNFTLRLETGRVEVSRISDLAYSQGTYRATFTQPGGNEQIWDTGTYAIVYRKVENGWKAITDIRASSQPAGANR